MPVAGCLVFLRGVNEMKIMVGYDGSEMAHRALLVAQKRAKSMQAELHIFTAAGTGKLDSPQNNRLQEGLKDSEMLC
jgi:nucleotide-binding universal stress UspA family protein